MVKGLTTAQTQRAILESGLATERGELFPGSRIIGRIPRSSSGRQAIISEAERQSEALRQTQLIEEQKQRQILGEAKLRTISGQLESQQQEPTTPREAGFFERLTRTGGLGFPGSQLFFPERRREIVEQVKQIRREGFLGFAFGSTGERVVGVGGIQGEPLVTFKQIGMTVGRAGLPGRVAEEFIPTTPGGIALVGVGAGVLKSLPGAVRLVADIGIGGFGTRQALRRDLPLEKRIAGGIIGGVGFLAAGVEGVPLVKGLVARFRPGFAPVKTQEIAGFTGVRVIDIPGDEAELLALIPGGQPRGIPPKAPAFVRGGFGFSRAEQQAFIGRTGTVATSQIGFLKGSPQEEIALSKFLFATPPDRITGIAQTRVSRLGLTDFFKFPGRQAEIGLLPTKPQIILFKDVKIGIDPTKGFRGGFAAGGVGTSELEVVTLKTIISGGKIGRTVIKGQAVDIFSATLGKGSGDLVGGLKSIGVDVSSLTTQRVPLLSLFGGVGARGRGLDFRGGVSTAPISRVAPSSFFPTLPVSPPSRPTADFSFFEPTRQKRERGTPSLPPTFKTPFGIPPLPPSRPPTERTTTFPTLIPPFDFPPTPPESPVSRVRARRSDRAKPKKRRKITKFIKEFQVAPSLTGITLFQFGGIFGKLPKAKGRLGILPSKIRFRPKQRRRKKR